MVTLGKPDESTAGSGTLRQVMRKHPLFFYFFLAYAFSWITLIPYVLSSWGILPQAPFFNLFFIVHTFGPAVAAIAMTGIVEGRAGIGRLRQRIRQGRAGWQWYPFILVGIPLAFMLGIIVLPGALASFQGLPPALLVSYPLTYVIVFFGGGPLGEEIGWRGFALPRMQPRYGPLRGTLLLGVLWCFWHLLDFLTPVHGAGVGAALTAFLTNMCVYLLLVLSLAIILTWVYNHTRGSIFIAILAHASVDTPELTLVPLFLAVDANGVNLAALIGFGVLALLVLVLTRGRLGYRPGQVQAEVPGEPVAQAIV